MNGASCFVYLRCSLYRFSLICVLDGYSIMTWITQTRLFGHSKAYKAYSGS